MDGGANDADIESRIPGSWQDLDVYRGARRARENGNHRAPFGQARRLSAAQWAVLLCVGDHPELSARAASVRTPVRAGTFASDALFKVGVWPDSRPLAPRDASWTAACLGQTPSDCLRHPLSLSFFTQGAGHTMGYDPLFHLLDSRYFLAPYPRPRAKANSV